MNTTRISKQVRRNRSNGEDHRLSSSSLSLVAREDLQHQCVLLNQEYDLTIIDNAGSDQYTLHHNDFENSDAYILVYAIDDLQRLVSLVESVSRSLRSFLSFEMVSKIREKIMSTSTTTR